MNKHTILPLAVATLSLAFINPGMIIGNHTMTTLFLVATLLLLVSTYGYYVLVDRADDEREEMIRSFADRLASLSGMATLLSIIGWCSITGHQVPVTIIIVLVIMVSAKAFGQWYACKYY